MKIIFIGPAHPYRGGLASYNERMAKQLINEGHDVRIETFKLQYPSILFPGKTQLSDSPKPNGLDINRTVNSINPFNWLNVGLRIKKECADLVIVRFWLPFMGPCLGAISSIIRSNKKTKVISIVDNIIPHEKRIGDKLLANYFTSRVDGFLCMSQSVVDDLYKFDSKKPRGLTPHPLFDNFGKSLTRDSAIKELNLNPDCRYLLFFGFIRDYKGLDLLLDAMSNPWFEKANVKLLVAGEFYSNEEKYAKQIRDLKLQDRVILHTHFIRNEDVSAYFSVSDIVVQPYKSATQSGVTQIAYHFNSPMLVTDVGGLAEICPDQKVGYVVDVSSNSIALAIKDFFDNERHDEFVENVAEEKKRYSWEILISKLIEVYDQCLN